MKNQTRGCLQTIGLAFIVWGVASVAVSVPGCVQPVQPAPSPVPVDPVQPTPAPELTIDAAAELGIRQYAELSATVFESLAVEIEKGEIASQTALADRMDEWTKKARLTAFEEMRNAWYRGNGNGKGGSDDGNGGDDNGTSPTAEWDRAGDAAKCRQTAAGFRRAVAK